MLRLRHKARVLNMPLRNRLCSTSLVHPDKIFSKAVPLPPPWPKPASLASSQSLSSLQWKKASDDNQKLVMWLGILQRRLRFIHKRKIRWPNEGSVPSNMPPNEYLAILLRPIVETFNQLYATNLPNVHMEYIPIAFGESIYGGTFTADHFEEDKITAPIVLCLADDIFDTEGHVSSRVDYALSKALEYRPTPPSIIISNFKDITVFFPPSRACSEPVFERVYTTQPSLALRVVSTAFLFQVLLNVRGHMDAPAPDIEIDMDLIGPPQNPNQPLRPDEQMLETHRRNSDFDFVTLIHDRPRALQFFRWHDQMQQRHSKVVARPNDTLVAVTNEIGMDPPKFRPIYPYDASEIPSETAAYLETIQRESPLVNAGIADSFERSRLFTIQIQNVLAEGSQRGICTLYRCHITSIDGNPVSSQTLCLKLFDDRLQKLHIPDEDDPLFTDEYLPQWFQGVVVAEMHALNEAFAYNKLLPAQGTVIPWFYGIHQFTLPDGTVLYGLLMEYLEGGDLESDYAKELSPERQLNMIHSCRHAVRVLDVADVSQRDWHTGQILLYRNPVTQIEHAVLVDFASTTQTWDLAAPNLIQNYFGVFRVLLGRTGDVAFDQELVWKQFGEPDDWDPIVAFMRTRPDDEASSVDVKARNMFPYISSTPLSQT